MKCNAFCSQSNHVSIGARQRGAATLIVVMILFFVVTLTAAYTSRNLIFEQRTSINQYQSTKSAEAAEAGIEWALTMLNSGRIDENCLPTADPSKNSFRQRYLTFTGGTGDIQRTPNPSNPDVTSYLWSACSFNGTSWSCACPQPDGTLSSLPAGIAAFSVRFFDQYSKPGVIRIEVNGCNSFDMACITGVQPGTDPFKQCQSTACSLITQYSSLRMIPTAAVTAKQSVAGTQLSVLNTDAPSGGVTIHSGVAVNVPALVLISLPGTPPNLSMRTGDGALSSELAVDTDDCTHCLFSSVFGLRPATYRNQPAAVQVDCSTVCTSTSSDTELGKALAAERGSIIWLKGTGGLALSSATDAIGSSAKPMTLVVEGPVSLAAGAKVVGLVYASSISLDSAEIRGALVSASTVLGSGTAQVVYDPAVLAKLQLLNGSFVRVPGSWRDFP
jgi:Tfp pilus assembly protein PilX